MFVTTTEDESLSRRFDEHSAGVGLYKYDRDTLDTRNEIDGLS